jgi:hypothetical protein
MKKYIFNVTIVFIAMSSLNAEAKNYKCSFTEPFFDMEISTIDKTISIKDAVEPSNSKTIQIVEQQLEAYTFKINNDIEISFKEEGSDGMSPLNFPYQIKYGSLFGGCSSEDNFYKTSIKRFPAFQNATGLTLVNYWPGEYGNVLGYKVLRTVKLAKEQTYKNLESSEMSSKSCTLKRGHRFIPSLAQKYENYSSIQRSNRYVVLKDLPSDAANALVLKTGDHLIELTYAAEGFCIVEHKGVLSDMFCPSNSPELFNKIQPEPIDDLGEKDIAEGEYVYTKCVEGHSAWVPKIVMEKDTRHFKSDQDINGHQ